MADPSTQFETARRNGPLISLQKRRLEQILIALGSTLLLAFVGQSFRGWAITSLILVCAFGAVLIAFWVNRRGHVETAVQFTVITIMAAVSILLFNSEGLYDEAVLAFPAILLCASMLGSRRLFIYMSVTVLLVLAATGAAHLFGWHLSVPKNVGADRLVNVLSITAVTAFFIWMISGDLHRAMRRLKEEKDRIHESHLRIEALAHRDTLTNLPNRTLAKDRLAQLMSTTRRHGGVAAIMFLDLDNFKTINDSLGHGAGDSLLCQVADRLCSVVRDSDTVSRLGGDEFLLLMGDHSDEESVAVVAQKVIQQMALPYDLQGHKIVVTGSLGVALYPRDGADIETLLKNADMAMYQAKEAGRNAVRFFTPSMNSSVLEHLQLASGLRTALEEKELQLHYQPQFDLQTGRLIGAEALLRWQHPSLGAIPPSKFIPVAEHTGLINEIGAWVLEEACRQAKAWRDAGLGELTVAVNVSPIQFSRDDIEREVSSALAKCQLPASALELELTESLLVDDTPHVSQVLHRLHEMGVKFSIDDFGTGYSNLGYLKRFEVQRLKIDQTFVQRMLSHRHDEGIVRAIIEMAHCLELEVLAEGIEDAATMQRLTAFGCEAGQGFLWSPAVDGAAFESYVRRYREA